MRTRTIKRGLSTISKKVASKDTYLRRRLLILAGMIITFIFAVKIFFTLGYMAFLRVEYAEYLFNNNTAISNQIYAERLALANGSDAWLYSLPFIAKAALLVISFALIVLVVNLFIQIIKWCQKESR